MPRIPRSEQTVDFRPQMQPFSTGDGYEAPGKGLQKIGQGIAALGQGISSLQGMYDKEDEFNSKLAALDHSNQWDKDELDTRAAYNGDGAGYAAERAQKYQDSTTDLLSKANTPKARQMMQLYIERKRGSVVESATVFENSRRSQSMYSNTEAAITGEFGKLNVPDGGNPYSDEEFDQKSATALASADAMINSMPQPEAVKERLRDHAAQQFMATLGARPEGKSYPEAMKWIERFKSQQPQQQGGRPGGALPKIEIKPSPISLAPNIGRQRSEPIKGFIVHETMGSDNLNGNVSWANKTNTGANYYIDKDGGVFQVAPDERSMNHAGKGRGVAGDKRPDLTNGNTLSVEIMTRRGERPNEQQIEAARALVAQKSQQYGFTDKDVFGHGEVAPGHRMAIEGMDVVKRVREHGFTALGGPMQTAQAQGQTGGIKGDLTAYAPQAGASNKDGGEGNYLSAKPGPDGKSEVRTLEDFASGASKYVTIAGNPKFNGKSYTIPKIEFMGKDGKVQVLENVPAVVHDTGSAFKTAPEGRFDVPVARDATEAIRNKNHELWNKNGVEFIPEGQKSADAAPESVPVSKRGLVQYAGLTGSNDAGPQPADGVRPTNTIPGAADATQIQPAQQAPTQVAQAPTRTMSPGVGAKVFERLTKAMPALQAQHLKQIDGMVGQIEDMAAKGYEVSDDVIGRAAQAVAATGNPALSQRMEMISSIVKNSRATNQSTPGELNAIVQGLEAQALKGPATPQQVAAIEFYKKKLKETETALGSNPYELGTRNGLLPAPPPPFKPELGPEQFKAALIARQGARDMLQQKYQRDLPIFQPSEIQTFTDFMQKTGTPADVRLGVLRTMYDALGKDMPVALKEIAKDAPELATVGWLSSQNADPMAMKDAVRGLDLKRTEGFKSRLPSGDEVLKQSDTITGIGNGAFAELPEAKQYAISTAKLIYEARAERKGIDPKSPTVDPDLWTKALNEAMGQNKSADGKITYGGIGSSGGWFSSAKVYVPPWVKTDGGLSEVMTKLRMSDLIAMSPAKAAAAAAGREEDGPSVTVPIMENGKEKTFDEPGVGPVGQTETLSNPGVQSAVMPGTPSGKPASIGEIRNATLVWIGGSRYLLRSGSAASGEPEYIGVRGTQQNYVLDLEKLRPTIEGRVAKDTFRALR